MEFNTLLANAKWDILAALAKGDVAASEIARATGNSLANVSQQTKLLEAYGLVKIGKEVKEGPGKPKLRYTLNKEFVHLAFLRKGFAGQKSISLDPLHKAILNIWFLPKADEHYFLQKFFWQHEAYIDACSALAVVDSTPGEIHLLVIAPAEKLEKLRKEFSKITVENMEKAKKTIVSWTHSLEELEEGLERGEEYFKNLVKHLHIIIDEEGLFSNLKR